LMPSSLVWELGGVPLMVVGEGSELTWARPLGAWMWVAAVCVCGMAGWWSYRRVRGAVWARAGLGAVRALLLLALVVLIAGPQVSSRNERIEEDWMVLLVDRSSSMMIADVEDDSGARITREQQLRRALGGAWEELSAMASDRRVLWMGFGGDAWELGQSARGSATGRADDASASETGSVEGLELGEPDAQRTRLGRAIERAVARTAGRNLSGIVVVSDGASLDEPSERVLSTLRRSRVRVVTVPLGSPDPVSDVAVVEAESPGEVFLGDEAPVRVVVRRLAGEDEGLAAGLRVVDEQTGNVLGERLVELGPEGQWEGTVAVRASREGEQRWRVEVDPNAEDLVAQNNQRSVRVSVVDRPIRVVHIDGYPRWEFRYLRNLLIREESVRSSSVLIASDRRFVQEGDEPIDGVPSTAAGWAPFDVVVIGDMRSELFSEGQLRSLRAHISERGAGLLWISGPGGTPESWASTALGDLLPVRVEGGGAVPVWGVPVTMLPGPAAGRVGVLGTRVDQGIGMTGWPGEVSDPSSGWSQLRWAERIDADRIKPGAEVVARALAVGDGQRDSDDRAGALVVSMRYGAGRVVYVGTDETWRWRFGRGEGLFERFWVPLVRELARSSLGRGGEAARVVVSPSVVEVGVGAQVVVEVLDPALVGAAPDSVRIRVRGPGEEDVGGLELARESGSSSLVRYRGSWTGDRAGQYEMEVSDGRVTSGSEMSASVEVRSPSDERARPNADHGLLARLREGVGATDGVELAPDELGRVGEVIQRDEVRVEMEPDIDPLWDRPLALIVVLGLLTLEWVSRRLLSLP